MVMSQDFISSIQTRQMEGEALLAWGVLLGTIPVGLTGFFFKESIELNLRTLEVIAFATLFFGVLLGFSDWLNRFLGHSREIIRSSDILIIGCFQALALIPGTSRSGITITAALLIGLSRSLSVKFSFLLSIPAIAIVMIVKTFDLVNQVDRVDWSLLLLGFIISAITAYATIVFFIRLVERIGLLPFVIYRLLLGALLLAI
jgi:undecaprenyl-diphosphatase